MVETISKSHKTAASGDRLISTLVRTSAQLLGEIGDTVKSVGISEPQFNILRILRGGGAPLACRDVASQMVTRQPDITRLLDRLERQKLVRRLRSKSDRRVVHIQITDVGLELLATLDAPFDQLRSAITSRLSESERKALIAALEKLTVKPSA